MKYKKGSVVVAGFFIIFIALLFAIFLGLAVFSFNLVTETLGQDVEIGQVNLQNVTNITLGRINTGMINNADTIGIIFLFGMLILMIINGYYLGSKSIKLFFVVDIFILILFFIPSIYVAQVYEIFINSTTVFNDTYINIIPKTSKFILNLPTIIATTGIITMILGYAGIRKSGEEDEANIQGF